MDAARPPAPEALMTLRILTVCTGNVCRSPQAEQLLRARWHGPDAPTLSSAGTHALVGDTMPPEAAALSRELGGDPSAHEPRLLTKRLVEESDLLLALAREHRSAIARLSPRAARRTFTLRELARILSGLAADGETHPTPEAWIERANARRGWFADDAEADDVVDPYRLDEAIYRRSAQQVDGAVTAIVRVLAV